MHHSICIYAPRNSNRLQYILDWIFNERLGIAYTLTDDAESCKSFAFSISYGVQLANSLYIPDTGLLWEKGVSQKKIEIDQWHNIPTLFADKHAGPIPFDIFSAMFFLISRYEEYYSFTPDKHGRYPATDSILYKNDWLERPLADEWIEALRLLLIEKTGNNIPAKSFSYIPSYDIDIAWSYKHKGWKRTTGGLAKDAFCLKFISVFKRLAVLNNIQQDPYDSFAFLQSLHIQYRLKPLYFILAALHTDSFDKNIHPLHPAMQKLIKSFAQEGIAGIHPSYNTNADREKFAAEKMVLEKIISKAIHISRQHYIRLQLPDTYRQLIAANITDDYSMGYGSHIGFRAGTGSSFKWYDVLNDVVTELFIHPFCFMDSTAHYDMILTAEEAFERLEKMAEGLKNCHSQLITVFHNFALGTDAEWRGWQAHYAGFIKKVSA